MTDHLLAKLRFSEEEAEHLVINRRLYRLAPQKVRTDAVIYDLFYRYQSQVSSAELEIVEASSSLESGASLIDYWLLDLQPTYLDILVAMVKDDFLSFDECETELAKDHRGPFLSCTERLRHENIHFGSSCNCFNTLRNLC